MNLARGVEPFRNNAVFTQSPLTHADSPWQNAKTSALLHRETVLTAFQYPFALNLNDCKSKPEWTKALLKAIGELNDVAGNHARSYFEMAPASIVMRLSKQLVAGYDTYGFDSSGNLTEIVRRHPRRHLSGCRVPSRRENCQGHGRCQEEGIGRQGRFP